MKEIENDEQILFTSSVVLFSHIGLPERGQPIIGQ
jgi:hypothetical protein